jgi:endogenous inhibitor of DNA gyrase (YacG/DUF329 family)
MTPAPIRCPTCRRLADAPASNPHFPFCSERCRTLDLGRWLDGAYAVPLGDADEDDDGSGSSPPEDVPEA